MPNVNELFELIGDFVMLNHYLDISEAIESSKNKVPLSELLNSKLLLIKDKACKFLPPTYLPMIHK